jgi:hypothetical protein
MRWIVELHRERLPHRHGGLVGGHVGLWHDSDEPIIARYVRSLG